MKCVNSVLEAQSSTEMGELLHLSVSSEMVSMLHTLPYGAISPDVSVLQHRQL